MRHTHPLIALIGVILISACHHGPPPEPPRPEPSEADIALRRHAQDSVDAAARATAAAAAAAAEAAVQAANRARADSIEQVRKTAEAEAREATARRNTELRNELGAMVHFESATARLGGDDQLILDRKVAIMNANPSVRLKITGACDDRGSTSYNLALGTRRATAVRRYLMGKGIDTARLDQMSSGEGSPIDTADGQAAWARNRRAEFSVVSGDMPLAMK